MPEEPLIRNTPLDLAADKDGHTAQPRKALKRFRGKWCEHCGGERYQIGPSSFDYYGPYHIERCEDCERHWRVASTVRRQGD